MDYIDTLKKYIHALNEEVIELKKRSYSNSITVTDGKLINEQLETYIYRFETSQVLTLNEDFPIELKIKGESFAGKIVNLDQFYIEIKINEKIKYTIIEQAHIVYNSWDLINALIGRMEDLKQKENYIVKKMIEDGKKFSYDSLHYKTELEEVVECNPITFVWGPPGTGKTTSLADLAIKYAKMGKRILIVSQSNISVDEAILKIKGILEEDAVLLVNGKVLRYGYIKNPYLNSDIYCNAYNYVLFENPLLEKKLKEIKKQLKKSSKLDEKDIDNLLEKRKECNRIISDKQKKLIIDCNIVASTISKVTIDQEFIEKNKFDIVIFDEASMAYVPQIFYAASLAKEKFLCFGDLKQLAPICVSQNKDLLQDIYYFLNMCRVENGKEIIGHKWLVILDEQYRFHKDISDFVNKNIYDGRIRNNKDKTTGKSMDKIVNENIFPGKPIVLVNTDDLFAPCSKNQNNSRFNYLHALIDVSVAITAFYEYGMNVGIITPYAAQAVLLKNMIRDAGLNTDQITCSTIHQFQGSERKVIIFDLVENYPNTKTSKMLSDNDNDSLNRLINVAMTRAQGKLIIVANEYYMKEVLPPNNIVNKLLKICPQYSDKMIYGAKLLELLTENKYFGKLQIFNKEEEFEALSIYYECVENVEKEILIYIPQTLSIDDEFEKNFEILKDELDENIIFKINKIDARKNKLTEILTNETSSDSPITLLDKKIVWFGMPVMKTFYKLKKGTLHIDSKIYAFFNGSKTAQFIENNINLVGGYPQKDKRKNAQALINYLNRKYSCEKCNNSNFELIKISNKYKFRCKKCKKSNFFYYSDINDLLDKCNILCPIEDGKLICRYDNKYKNLYLLCSEKHKLELDDIFMFDV